MEVKKNMNLRAILIIIVVVVLVFLVVLFAYGMLQANSQIPHDPAFPDFNWPSWWPFK